MGTKSLAALCRRVAIAHESGIDERKIWQREAERASGRSRGPIAAVRDAVVSGQAASDGVAAAGDFFPELFRQLTALGEQTGKQSQVFRRLADHYEHRVVLRRTLLAGITWPLIQLTAAVVIIGLLIWILGAISTNYGEAPYDILGLGLIGNRGLLIYIAIVATTIGVGVGLVWLVRSGAIWTRPIEHLLMRIPVVGGCLRTLALSRLSWALGLSLEAGMDIRRSLAFSLQSTHRYFYAQHIPQVQAAISEGSDVFTALANTHAFPDEFLDALQVGEQSGRMDESMLRLADQYQERAQASLQTLTQLAGFAVWALVALMIIAIIINFVASYAAFLKSLM